MLQRLRIVSAYIMKECRLIYYGNSNDEVTNHIVRKAEPVIKELIIYSSFASDYCALKCPRNVYGIPLVIISSLSAQLACWLGTAEWVVLEIWRS
ncbi:hypothetical protein TNIN_258381 [Trichonephila inaurata madagascariensis]|uniref:Uncharacterized protein n=1 Tax=Trichonephila inaurata madagascariensis TaxID=2747483 RepID=A0A8X7BNY7_9ARAC|nr:hypothetical protein TNIN_258381 [Trichonephila inaurata madagascariensis]